MDVTKNAECKQTGKNFSENAFSIETHYFAAKKNITHKKALNKPLSVCLSHHSTL